MSTPGVDAIQTAELAISASVSTAAVSTPGSAEVMASAGTASAAIPSGGAAEVSLSGGPLGNGSGFIMPDLQEWRILGSNVDATTSTLTVTTPTTTTGTACTVQFEVRDGATVMVTLTASTPEQNTPHIGAGNTRSAAYLGQVGDLWWRWWSGVESVEYQLVELNAVTIPGFNDPDVPSEG